MLELRDAIPDPDAVLALEPEELGGKILFLLRKRIERDRRKTVHPQNLVGEVAHQDLSRGVTGYPSDRIDELQLAVSEAMAWLVAQGFLVPAADSGANGWMVLSRRARKFETASDFRHFAVARRLNRELLHPAIAEKVWLSFIRGDFAEAVFTAMRAVEIAVRDAGALEQKQVGTKLMQAAFGQGGPLRDAGGDTSEEDGLMHLFIGAMGSYKNPHSHRNVPLDDAVEAIEIVTFASHLLRIVDSRRSNLIGP